MFSSYSPSSAYARSRARAERVYSDPAATYLDLAASATQSIQTTTADKKAALYYRRAHSEPPASPYTARKTKVDVAATVQHSAIKSTRASPEPDTRKIWRDYSSHGGYTGAESDCEMDARSDHYFASRESTPDVDAEADALLAGMGELGLNTSPFSACSAQAISTSLRLIEQQLQATRLLEKPDYRDSVVNAHNDEEPADVDARPVFIREDTPELAASPTSSEASLPDFGDADMPQDAGDVNMDDALAQLSAMSIFPKIPSLDEYTDADVREIHEALKSGPVPVQLLLDAFPICERAGWPEFPVRAPSPPSPSRSQEAVAARRAEKRCKASAPYNTRSRTRVVIVNTEYPLRPVLSWD